MMSDETIFLKESANAVLASKNFDGLNETQKLALTSEDIAFGNGLLIARTGNGKTLVAETRTHSELNDGNRVLYLVPSEHLKDAKRAEMSTWADEELAVSGRKNDAYRDGDVVFATFEGFYFTYLRHPGLVSDFNLVVLDDFHTLYDDYRGFTLEKAIAGIKEMGMSILAMSATIGNPDEIASWLGGRAVISDQPRQIELREIPVEINSRRTKGEWIGEDILPKYDGPYLVFNSSRSDAERRAQAIARSRGWEHDPTDHTFADYGSGVQEANRTGLGSEQIKTKIEDCVTEFTDVHQILAEMIEYNVAYHHAGLDHELKELIEKWYDQGNIDCLSLTTTLASGYDSPVKTVIIADYKRFDALEGGKRNVPTHEVRQWMGRAGREGHDHNFANAVILTKDSEDIEQYLDPVALEPIASHVAEDELMQKLLLELVYTGTNRSDDILGFIDETLFTFQSKQDVLGLSFDRDDFVRKNASKLESQGLIEVGPGELRITSLGRAIVEYGMKQYGRYELSGAKKMYDFACESEDFTKVSVLENICENQRITLYEADEHDMSDEFAIRLRNDQAEDPMSKEARTAGVLVYFWCENRELDEASEASGLRAEYCKSVARGMGDAVDLMIELFKLAPNTETPPWLQALGRQIPEGITDKQLAVVENVRGVGRLRVRNLHQYLAEAADRNPSITGDPMDKSPIILIDQLYGDSDRNGVEDLIDDRIPGFGKTLAKRLMDYYEESMEPVN